MSNLELELEDLDAEDLDGDAAQAEPLEAPPGREDPGAAAVRIASQSLWRCYPAGWPACPGCGDPTLFSRRTCGKRCCDNA